MSLFRRLPRNRREEELDSGQVIPLTVDRASRLRLMRDSRFVSSTLKEHVAECGEFCWQVAGTNEYIIGSQWRRRTDIGHLVEMTHGPSRALLVNQLLDAFRRSNMQMAVLACEDLSLFVSFYAKLGFERLDEILELERLNGSEIPPVRAATVRPYSPEDICAVMDADSHSFPWLWQNSRAELEWYSSLPEVEIYVVENPNQLIVGYAGMTIRGPFGHLDRLSVHSSWQHQGYGAALLSFTIKRMEQRRAKRITLSTQVHNTRSQSLYRKFGFHHTFRSQVIYGLRLD